jgi:hypothetical protein
VLCFFHTRTKSTLTWCETNFVFDLFFSLNSNELSADKWPQSLRYDDDLLCSDRYYTDDTCSCNNYDSDYGY